MPAPVQLGPPRITLAEGTSLFVTSPDGTIDSGEGHGFFVHVTRLLSRYRIRMGRRRWTMISSAPITHYSAAFFFINPGLESPLGSIRRGTVALTLERTL